MILKNTKEYIKNKKKQCLYGIDFIHPVHPGSTLQDELDFFSITQKELAKKIGYTPQTVNRIIKGKEPITTDIALAIERVFDSRPSAQFWLNIQSNYDKEMSNPLARIKRNVCKVCGKAKEEKWKLTNFCSLNCFRGLTTF